MLNKVPYVNHKNKVKEPFVATRSMFLKHLKQLLGKRNAGLRESQCSQSILEKLLERTI